MTGALSGRDLDDVRRDVEATWPGTAILSAPGTALDAEGGWTDGYSPSGTVGALVHPKMVGGGEFVVGEELQGKQQYILSCPHDATISTDHRVTYAGTVFEVIEVLAWGPAEIAARAVLSRVGV